jgi:hypothetical protein
MSEYRAVIKSLSMGQSGMSPFKHTRRGSMDGLKLAAAIRRRWPPIEIILTSGYRSVTASELPERCVFTETLCV